MTDPTKTPPFALDPTRRAGVLRDGYADAVGGLRYIEQRYGRLDGVGWDRVFDHFEDTVVIPEREGLPAGYSDSAPSGSDLGEGVVERMAARLWEATGGALSTDVRSAETDVSWEEWLEHVAKYPATLGHTLNTYREIASRLVRSTPSPTPAPDGEIAEQARAAAEAWRVPCSTDPNDTELCRPKDDCIWGYEQGFAAALSTTPAIRDQAFEEAARQCDEYARECREESDFGPSRSPESCYDYAAKAIRALKGTSPTGEWAAGTYADKAGTFASPSPDLLKEVVEALSMMFASRNRHGSEAWLAGEQMARDVLAKPEVATLLKVRAMEGEGK